MENILNDEEYYENEYQNSPTDYFKTLPEIAKPLVDNSNKLFDKIKNELYKSTAFINLVCASIPKECYQAVFTDEQRKLLAKGAVKLMTKKDGTVLAEIIDAKNKRIVTKVSLKKVELNPEMNKMLQDYSTQMQLAQISEQIKEIQVAIEQVVQGMESDRLALAYSCQQKLLQAMSIKNLSIRNDALLKIAMDSEDARNKLMQSQTNDINFIREQPQSLFAKILGGAGTEKIDACVNRIRNNMNALNMVSLVEALSYQNMDETEAAQKSLKYYSDYMRATYLKKKGLLERLDSIDPSPKNYWTKSLPKFEENIRLLPCNTQNLIGEPQNE